MAETLKIAIAGLGTVGASVVKNIQDKKAALLERSGKNIEIIAVSARSRKDRGVDLSAYAWKDDPRDLVNTDADAIIELIGGEDGPAYETVEAALKAGKHVVTANKAMLAKHGNALAGLAESQNLSLCFEAAVAGAVPIVKTLREALSANDFKRIYGIFNGTCNYVLSKMEATGADFADVLKEAQALGYAEAEPTLDVGGFDAAHKLTILSALAFGAAVRYDATFTEGIEKITAFDIRAAREIGYRIKLLGIAALQDGKILQRVHPCLIPLDAPIANVNEVLNAAVVDSDYAGQSICVGRGAGGGPTASAVVADIVDIARGVKAPTFGVSAKNRRDYDFANISERKGKNYLRLTLTDKPGSIAAVTEILAKEGVSVETMHQYGRNPNENVPVIITTHEAEEKTVSDALTQIAALPVSVSAPVMIRIFRP